MDPKTAAWALLTATALTWQAGATTYRVDPAAPAASDTGPGTAAAPLKTLTAAAARVQPGDTVYVKGGTYRESFVWTTQPWDAKMERITLAAYPGERPVIRCSDVLAQRFEPVRVVLRKPVAEVVREAGHDPDAWRRLIGVDGPAVPQAPPIVPAGTPAAAAAADTPFVGIYACPLETVPQMLFVDDRRLDQIGLQGSPDRAQTGAGFRYRRQWDGRDAGDLRPGSYYHDAKTRRLFVWLADGSDPSRHTLEVPARACGIFVQGVWTVSGFDVLHGQDLGAKGHAGLAVMGHDSVVENCRALHNEFFGLMVQGYDITVRGCEVAGNGLCGLASSFGLRMLVENNEFHDNTWRGDVDCCCDGNKVHQWKDARFLRNRFHDEPGPALWLDINCNNALIAENRFDNCALGIYFEISRWGVIANNVLRNGAVGIWSYASDVLIAHNVTEGCGEGIRLTGSPRRCNYNQSVYLFEPTSETLMAVRNNLIINNIVINSPGDYIGATRDDAYNWGNFSDHNAFVWTLPAYHWGSNHIKFMAGFDDYYGRLQFWRLDRHGDENSLIADPRLYELFRRGQAWQEITARDIVGDPRFVDPLTADFRLRPDSPLHGRGLRLPMTLNSVCPPAPDFTALPRAWAKTFADDAPKPGLPSVTKAWDQPCYRLQPLPKVHRLADLDALAPDSPGLNDEWRRSGQYPRFRTDGQPDAATPEDYAVYPDNRLGDPGLKAPIAPVPVPPATTPAGQWFTRGGVHSFSGMACANLLNPEREEQLAYQKIGPIRPNAEFLLLADLRAEAVAGTVTAEVEVSLAAGDGRTPLRSAKVTATPGQTRHWTTHELHYRAGPQGQDPAVGQDLYVVLAARTSGPAGGKPGPEPVAFGRWDNLLLFSSEPPPAR